MIQNTDSTQNMAIRSGPLFLFPSGGGIIGAIPGAAMSYSVNNLLVTLLKILVYLFKCRIRMSLVLTNNLKEREEVHISVRLLA
jgi:hypothetical protein